MKAFSIQFLICFILACVSVALETMFGVGSIHEYMVVNGLNILLALFAINMASVTYVVTRLLSLEAEYDKPYHFDNAKKAARHSIYEQFSMIILVYVSMFITPILLYFKLPSTSIWFESSDVILRAAVFMTLYATLDCSKSIIDSSLDPRSFKKTDKR